MTWAALEAFANTAALRVFGELMSVDGQTVQADFHEPHQEIMLGDNSIVSAVPRVVMLSAQAPAEPVGKAVVARSRNFTIADARPDGRGLTVLELEAA